MHFHETEQSVPMEGNLPPVRGSSSCLQVGKVGLCSWSWDRAVAPVGWGYPTLLGTTNEVVSL